MVITALQRLSPALDRILMKVHSWEKNDEVNYQQTTDIFLPRSKKFVLVSVFGTSILKEGNKFEFTHHPQVNTFTKRERTKTDINLSWFRPVGTIGFVVFRRLPV
ncbi:hypothetical protein N7501_003596 [Penicillium viridicatum]|nr:hypothetical protein N7501_003596 [Penicillium viridicatum]